MSAFDLSVVEESSLNHPLRVFANMLEDVQSTSSKSDKQAFIQAYIVDHAYKDEIRELLRLALSPYVRFGIASLPDIPVSARPFTDDEVMTETRALLTLLANRDLTGNAARDAVAAHLAALDDSDGDGVSTREAVRRILLKDLRAGFSESTVNKVVKGCIPVFECQLAHSEMPELDQLEYPVMVQPKYDGVRCIAIKRAGVVTLFSRNGIPFENFLELNDYLERKMPEGVVLDGEVLHRTLSGEDGYQKVMKRAKASPGKNDDIPITFRVFDGMSLSEWESQKCPRDTYMRYQGVSEFVDQLDEFELVQITPNEVCSSQTDVQRVYARHLADGWEGVIIKTLTGAYTFKRNKTWMKLKPFGSADLKVVGAFEGNGKYAGMLGGLICEGAHDGKTVHVEVGSGFTDYQRESFWRFRGDVIGKLAEVRFQAMIKAQDSEIWSLRFPTFLRLRETDTVGKL